MSDILSIAGYGKISRITSFPTVTMKTEKNKQAKYLVASPIATKSIDDINLSSHKKLKIPEKYGHVFILNENESLECKKKVTNQPADVSCIDDRTIAISYNYHPFQIKIINISSKQTEKLINTSNRYYGITNGQRKLIYCLYGKGIMSVDFTRDDVSTIFKQPEMTVWNYVTASRDKLYRTNPANDTVTCYNTTGEKVWEYNDKSVLKDIYGVTTEKNDDVHVASLGNNSIVVLSPDGKHARRLTGEEDNLNQPHGIYLDKTRNNLLIACFNGDVHMYKVS
ncbi:unnamed protein product [Mytilus coruscus]|uniref:Uncharacterized protein n=1 Tax=Mytilus coruscus TaxID=42192 RepID=A0A6J8DS31_MYTCO|nr:unnamed protein product [Mytilus coruscus]